MYPPNKTTSPFAGAEKAALLPPDRPEAASPRGNGARLRRLIGPFAREIRNPIASLITASEVLIEQLGPSHPCAGYARLISDTSSRLHDSMSDLIALALPLNFNLVEIDLARFITAEIERVVPAAECNGVRFVTAFPSERIPVAADRDALALALNKLLTHQIDVMQFGGVLQVRVESLARHRVRVLSSDTGPDIPERELARLFEPFFAVDGRHPGMALALFRRIILETNGSVAAWTGTGGGLTVEMILPTAG